jgi:hypothetical protein
LSQSSKALPTIYSFRTQGSPPTGHLQLQLMLKEILLLLTTGPSLSASIPFLFTLAPATLAPHQGYYNESSSAWGGSVIELPEAPQRFHMFNGVYTKNCGVNYWRGKKLSCASPRVQHPWWPLSIL